MTWFLGQGQKTLLPLAPLFPEVGIVAALSVAQLALLTMPAGLTTLTIASDTAGRRTVERLGRPGQASIAITVLRPRLIDLIENEWRTTLKPLQETYDQNSTWRHYLTYFAARL